MQDQENPKTQLPPTYAEILAKAKQAHITITQLCEEAGVCRSRLTRWRKAELAAFSDKRKIDEVLNAKLAQRLEQAKAMAETRPTNND
jgi:hypothetical protein